MNKKEEREGSRAKRERKEGKPPKVNKARGNDNKLLREENAGKQKFPNFSVLTEEEKLVFFEALATARKNVEKRGVATRQRFGTIHDEYLTRFEQNLKTEQENVREEPCESNSSAVDAKFSTLTYNITGVSQGGDSSEEKFSEGSLGVNSTVCLEKSFSETKKPKVLDQCEKLIQKDTKKMIDLYIKKKKKSEGDMWERKEEKEKQMKESVSLAMVLGKTPKTKNTPRFDALSPEEKQIFFQILDEARKNVAEKNPQRKNEILPLDSITRLYEGCKQKTDVFMASGKVQKQKKEKCLNVKVTLTSGDNQRLKKKKRENENKTKEDKKKNTKEKREEEEEEEKKNTQVMKSKEKMEEEEETKTEEKEKKAKEKEVEKREEKEEEEKKKEDDRRMNGEEEKEEDEKRMNAEEEKGEEEKEEEEKRERLTKEVESVEEIKDNIKSRQTLSNISLTSKDSSRTGKEKEPESVTELKTSKKIMELTNGQKGREEEFSWEETPPREVTSAERTERSKREKSEELKMKSLNWNEEEDKKREVIEVREVREVKSERGSLVSEERKREREKEGEEETETSRMYLGLMTDETESSEGIFGEKCDEEEEEEMSREENEKEEELLRREIGKMKIKEEEMMEKEERETSMTSPKVMFVEDNVVEKIRNLILYLEAKTRKDDRLEKEYIKLLVDYVDYLSRMLEALALKKKNHSQIPLHVQNTYIGPGVHLKFNDDPSNRNEEGTSKKFIPRSVSATNVSGNMFADISVEKVKEKPTEEFSDPAITASISNASLTSDVEPFVPPSTGVRKMVTSKVRLLQDLLKQRAEFVESSTEDFKVVYLPQDSVAKETPQEINLINEEVMETERNDRTPKFFKFLMKCFTCRKKKDEDRGIFENLKGEAVRVDVCEEKNKDPANATLNQSVMEVLKAAGRKKVIEKYYGKH